MLKKVYDFFCILIFIITCIIIIVFPQTVSYVIKQALLMCANSIIPSLFPFMVITQVLSLSNISYKFGKILSPIMSPVLGINKNLCGAVFVGLLGGFPNGVHSVGITYNKGLCTKADAEHAVSVCNNCSFAFVYTIVGINVLGSIKNGLILYISMLICCIETSWILKFVYQKKSKNDTFYEAKAAQIKSEYSISEIICNSISESAKNLINVCGYIIVFYTLSWFMLGGFTRGFLEISSGILSCTLIAFPENIIIIAVLVGFSGVSVIFQVSDACIKYGFSSHKFIASRFINAVLMPVNATLIMLLIPREAISVFNQRITYPGEKPTVTLYALICLAVLAGIYAIYKTLKNSNLYKK